MGGRSLAQVESDGSASTSSTDTVSRDTAYEILANRRRRYVIHLLQYHDEPMELGPLAEQVAAWEYETDPERVTSQQRKTVYTALQQRHLPRMDEAGLLTFDSRAGTVAPANTLSDLDIYAEVVPAGDFPWSHYYLGLSVVVGALLVAVWAKVSVLAALPDIAWGVFCVTAFFVSAVVNVVVTRGRKLGASERPPEVDA